MTPGGRAPGNSGPYSVSSAPRCPPLGESDIRAGLDRPAASPRASVAEVISLAAIPYLIAAILLVVNAA